MKITNLKLKNYRNCENIELNFNNFKNIIIGKNAQGKTNILESIYFLSCLKSMRTSKVSDLIEFGKDNMNICALLEKNSTEIQLNYYIDETGKKTFKINGVKSTIKDFRGILKTVIFSNEDLLLLRGTPENRRNWLDNAIFQIYPLYEDRLNKYEKLRIQKNNLLKSDKFDYGLMDVYNEQMSITGANIVFLRNKYLNEISNIAKIKHLEISNDETLNIYYKTTFPINDNIEQICENYKQALKDNYDEEIRRGQSLIGPHRDDIIFLTNDKDATKFASQGQQRTVVLALKSAELNIIKEKTDISPILLLDDVLAELDDLRQNYLLNSIDKDTQTIITSVDTLLFSKEFLNDISLFKIKNGSLEI